MKENKWIIIPVAILALATLGIVVYFLMGPVSKDDTPPSITSLRPSLHSTVGENFLTIGASYSDRSGINLSSVIIKVDGVDVTGDAIITPAEVTYELTAALAVGEHTVEVRVKDNFGNEATEIWTFTVEALPRISADNAAQIVLDEVIKPGELGYDLIAFMRSELLTEGDVIAARGVPEREYIIENDTWFFWINDFPFAGFSHPTRYVFMNARTGDYTIEIEGWWPQLNGEGLWEASGDYWDNEYWIHSTYVGSPPTSLNGSGGLDLANSGESKNGNSSSRNRALIVYGERGNDPNGDIPYSSQQWWAMMRDNFGFDVTFTDTENEVDNAMDNLSKELKPCENFSIYIVGHGRENDGSVWMGDGNHLTPEKFSKWVCRIDNGVHIAVTVDVCYSGKWIKLLKKWDNKVEIVYTSTDNDSIGWGDIDNHNNFLYYQNAIKSGLADPDPNPEDYGREATSGLIEDLKALAENFKKGNISWPALWQEAIKTANEKNAAAQNPEFFKQWTENNCPNFYPPCSGKGVQNPQEWKSDRVKDHVPPTVESTSPEDGEENVPVDAEVTVTFSEPMNKTATQNAFSIYPQTEGEFNWAGNVMIFNPLDKLIPETPYEVRISSKSMDLAWNVMKDDYVWVFLTGEWKG